MRNIFFLLATFSVIIMASVDSYGYNFDTDDSGGMKVSLSSLSFFNDDKEDSGESRSCSRDYDPEDQEYEVDIIGRKVPVRTRKSGTAIETR